MKLNQSILPIKVQQKKKKNTQWLRINKARGQQQSCPPNSKFWFCLWIWLTVAAIFFFFFISYILLHEYFFYLYFFYFLFFISYILLHEFFFITSLSNIIFFLLLIFSKQVKQYLILGNEGVSILSVTLPGLVRNPYMRAKMGKYPFFGN